MNLTPKQRDRIRKRIERIAKLAGAVVTEEQDDPLTLGNSLFSALNNLSAAAEWALETFRESTDE